jgi:glycosyltransferase involved in cell wall biosynthesis
VAEVETSWQEELFAQVIHSEITTIDARIWAVVTCRNEIDNLPGFFSHHRNLGIEHFIFVDDLSDDGSAEFLKKQADVILLTINCRYPAYKHEFRSIICDAALENKWVIFLDVDERLIYRDMERVSFPQFVDRLERNGCDAVIGIMVDGYQPVVPAGVKPDAPLRDQGYWFDSTGYRAVSTNKATQAHWKTPKFDYFGGAQERLFFKSPFTHGTQLERILSRISFDVIGRPRPLRWPGVEAFRHWLSNRLQKFSKSDGVTAPKQNKVPIIRWRLGTEFSGGVHRLNFEFRVWPDRVVLFHLKFNAGFASRVARIVEEESHAGGSEIYKKFAGTALSSSLKSISLRTPDGRKFCDSRDIAKSALF